MTECMGCGATDCPHLVCILGAYLEDTPMPNQPRPDNPARAFRCDAELWRAAKERAAERGETVTDVLIRALRRYTR